MPDVMIVSATRTAIGSFAGKLRDIPPTELGAIVVREALRRAKIEPGDVGDVVFGNVIHTEPKDMYLARVVALNGGIEAKTPCLTVNRLCGSGLQAIVSAAQHLMLGDADIAVAGGAESMSRAPHSTNAIRTGQKMGALTVTDMMLGALHDPFGHGHMGVTGENVARRWQVSRADQDALALESQRRAANAIREGRFANQITGVKVRSGREEVMFNTDEHAKPNTDMDGLRALKPAFDKEGTVTAGNASGINDGAAALVLMSEDEAKRRNAKSMARIVGYGHAGVEADVMGIGPVDAVRKLLARTGLKIS